MNFAAEPQKRCEAGHYKGFGGGDTASRHRFVQGGWRGLRSPARVVQPLARLERGSRSNGSAIPRLFTNRTVGTPPSVVAANGACARKPRHPPSLTIEDSGIFNTRYRHIAVSHAMLSCVKSAALCTVPSYEQLLFPNLDSSSVGRHIHR